MPKTLRMKIAKDFLKMSKSIGRKLALLEVSRKNEISQRSVERYASEIRRM